MHRLVQLDRCKLYIIWTDGDGGNSEVIISVAVVGCAMTLVLALILMKKKKKKRKPSRFRQVPGCSATYTCTRRADCFTSHNAKEN